MDPDEIDGALVGRRPFELRLIASGKGLSVERFRPSVGCGLHGLW